MVRVFLLALPLLLVSVALAQKPPAAAPGLRLDGTFIQYQGWMMKLDAAAWRREMEALRRAKMRTVLLQWLQMGDTRYIPADPKATDPTREIMTYADRHGMQVFVGLAMDDDWWKRGTEADYLDRAAATSTKLAEEAWKRYGAHPSFAGWYIPQEPWDGGYTDAQVDRLRGFLRRISDRCKALSGGKPVAFAPFFGRHTPPETFRRTCARMLTGSGVDILTPQDGVGANGWDDDVAGKVVPYFRALRDACLEAGVELWSDLESFRLVKRQPLQFAPADAARIGRQMVAEAPFVRRFVTFDFFHYMSPHRGPAQKKLYAEYLKRYVDRPFLPWEGRSAQVDPGFGYYRDRSPESVAAELRAAGYNIVLYVLTADSGVNPALIAAFRREGIGVCYVTFGNGTYSTKDLPPGWEAWKMVTRSHLEGKPLNDGYTRLCLNNPDYRAWKKRQMGRMLRAHPFEGVDIVEPHWPEYPGITSPAYACFCGRCEAAFRRMYPGEEGLPDILRADSPRAPAKNPALWQKWLAFRRATLTAFLDDLVNGTGGIRQAAPRAKVCTWTLALTEKEGLRRIREDHGEDAGEIARVVRPDMHCFQTHWPDWIRAELPPNYVEDYRPFVEQLRAAAPSLPLMIQADTGSQKQNRRSGAWIEAFEAACAAMGVGSTTYYEYFIGDYIYTDPPRVAEARRRGETLELRFTKRLDPATAGDPARYALEGGRVTAARVDGSRVLLTVEGLRSGARYALTLRGIADAADRRLFDDRPPAVLEAQTVRFVY